MRRQHQPQPPFSQFKGGEGIQRAQTPPSVAPRGKGGAMRPLQPRVPREGGGAMRPLQPRTPDKRERREDDGRGEAYQGGGVTPPPLSLSLRWTKAASKGGGRTRFSNLGKCDLPLSFIGRGKLGSGIYRSRLRQVRALTLVKSVWAPIKPDRYRRRSRSNQTPTDPGQI